MQAAERDDVPTGVPAGAVDDLLAAARRCVAGAIVPPAEAWLDRAVAAAEARRFKLDVSFALRFDARAVARASLNDKGEEVAFRARMRAALADSRAVAPAWLDGFFACAPPGEVQTTVGMKWGARGGAPARVSLYLEELSRSARAAAIHEAVARLALGHAVAPLEGLEPGAACVDVAAGQIVAFKSYGIALETADAPALALSPSLERFRAFFPRDPVRGTRRYLHARRFDARGALTGAKLLWMSEAHDADATTRAWAIVDTLRERLALPPSRPAAALDALRAGWRHEARLYPDLVALDVDADDRASGLLIYVSLK